MLMLSDLNHGQLPLNQIICGHWLDVAAKLPDEFVDTIITSPPYWGMRFYGEETKTVWGGDPSCDHRWEDTRAKHDNLRYRGNVAHVGSNKNPKIFGGKDGSGGMFCTKCQAWYGQLGLEPSIDLYLVHLWQVTDELYRVLKPTGVMFWNHGDSYFTQKGSCNNPGGGDSSWKSWNDRKSIYPFGANAPNRMSKESPAKCLALQNYRLILGMTDIDYRVLVEWRSIGRPQGQLEKMLKALRIQRILRNGIIWNKPNHMPSSVKDRFSNAYEPVFMFVKNNKPIYFYNRRTLVMANKKPKELREGIDWEWRQCIMCEGKGKLKQNKTCKRCKGIGKLKHSFWRSLDYWFDLDSVRIPHKDIRDYNRHAPFNYRVREAKKGHTGIVGVKSSKGEMAKYNHKGQLRETPDEKGGLGKHRKVMRELGLINQHSGYMLAGLKLKAEQGIDIRNPRGKNPGDAWIIPTQPCPEAHFATFPEKLVRPMIMASCPAEICKKCGKARVRIAESIFTEHTGQTQTKYDTKKQSAGRLALLRQASREKGKEYESEIRTTGWTDCGCNAGFEGGIVLDPFAGIGTVGLAVQKLGGGRKYILVEISQKYCIMEEKKLGQPAPV